MPEVNVKKQTSEKDEKGLEKRDDRGMSRRAWEPFPLSLMPSDFFSTDPLSMMHRFYNEMDRTFNRYWGSGSSGDSGTWRPAVEVAERNGQLQVRAELPGLKPEDVKVEVTDDALIIQGERKYEHEDTKGGVYRSERRYGQFYREIPLPEGANANQAKAQFKDGILEIALPLPEQKSNRRTVPIEGASTASSASHTQK